MTIDKVIEELKRKYPNKNIIQNSGEIICEIEPASNHPKWSKAIAVIDQSIPHFHIKAIEEYTVLKGDLILTVEGEDHYIPEGQSYIIYQMQHHSAKGNEAWVEVQSTPGWTPNDHIIVEQQN